MERHSHCRPGFGSRPSSITRVLRTVNSLRHSVRDWWFIHVRLPRYSRHKLNPGIRYEPSGHVGGAMTLGQWISLGPTEPNATSWSPFTVEQLRQIDADQGRPHTLYPISKAS